MSKQRIVFLIGLWVAVLPFLGFPDSWKNVLFVLSGFFLMWLGFSLTKVHARIRRSFTSFGPAAAARE